MLRLSGSLSHTTRSLGTAFPSGEVEVSQPCLWEDRPALIGCSGAILLQPARYAANVVSHVIAPNALPESTYSRLSYHHHHSISHLSRYSLSGLGYVIYGCHTQLEPFL